MKIVDSVSKMSTLAKILKKEGKSIGLVPTMGYLHEGHLSLVRTAKKHNDTVVMSIFVNPIQFGPAEDLDKYPRDFRRDEELARSADTDIIFYPSANEMYPAGYSSYVNVENLTDGLCGASRPGHFRGVTTVVTKLINIVKPDIAYFGQKDAQQAFVIKKMAYDLNMDVDIKMLPTIREKDGLAMSSRNSYLSERDRADAVIIYQALKKAESLIIGGVRDVRKVVLAIKDTLKEKSSIKIDYVAIVDTKTLKEVSIIAGEVLIALAVFTGKARLIDNIIIRADAEKIGADR